MEQTRLFIVAVRRSDSQRLGYFAVDASGKDEAETIAAEEATEQFPVGKWRIQPEHTIPWDEATKEMKQSANLLFVAP